mgnify:CR=1 FL=1
MTVAFQNSSFLNGGTAAATNTISGGASMANIYNTEALDNRYNYTDTKESYEVAEAGRDASINASIANIDSYIKNGEEDKVLKAYNQLLTEMSAQTRYSQLITEDGNDLQLRSVARQLIEQQIGCNLEEYLEKNTADEAETKNKQILYWNNADSTSQEDLLLEMCNIDKDGKHLNPVVGFFSTLISPFTSFANWITGGEKQ